MAVDKLTQKKASKKAPTKSVHADRPKREVVWNPRRVAVVQAMRDLGATSPKGARTAAEIAARAGTVEGVDLTARVDLVKVILDVYREAELIHNGYAGRVWAPDGRQLAYYLTKAGQQVDLARKEEVE